MAPIGHVYMFLGLENGTRLSAHGRIDDGVIGAIIDRWKLYTPVSSCEILIMITEYCLVVCTLWRRDRDCDRTRVVEDAVGQRRGVVGAQRGDAAVAVVAAAAVLHQRDEARVARRAQAVPARSAH